MEGKRQRANIDYKLLNEALFGDVPSEDLNEDKEFELNTHVSSENESDSSSEED